MTEYFSRIFHSTAPLVGRHISKNVFLGKNTAVGSLVSYNILGKYVCFVEVFLRNQILEICYFPCLYKEKKTLLVSCLGASEVPEPLSISLAHVSLGPLECSLYL
jgi:hypothetical protein